MTLQNGFFPEQPRSTAHRWRFQKSDRIGMGKHDYSLVETTPDGYILARLDNPELKEAFLHVQDPRVPKNLGIST